MYRISNAGKTLAVQKIQILHRYWNKYTNISYISHVHTVTIHLVLLELELPNTASEITQVVSTPKRVFTRTITISQ